MNPNPATGYGSGKKRKKIDIFLVFDIIVM